MIDIQEAQIYVGTYAKYNDGSLFGKWMQLSDYSDLEEFIEACKELHNDEEDPELMFQDWEEIPEGLINESWLSENFFDIRDAIDSLKDDNREAFMVWCTHGSYDISREDVHVLLSKFWDEYHGKYSSEEDFAYRYVVDCYDLPEFAQTYFDYEKFTNELFSTDYWFEGGYVFRR